MKKLIISFLFVSKIAAACMTGTTEAQFSGQIIHLNYVASEAGAVEHYTYQIQFQSFQPSFVCPMNEQDALTAVLEEPGFPLVKNGDVVSGVLVFDSVRNQFHIE